MKILSTGLIAAIMVTGLGAAVAHATPILSLSPQAPDLNLPFVSTSYSISGSTGTFTSTITGDVGSFNFGASSVPNGYMTLNVTFTKTGSAFIPTSGSIDVGDGSTSYFKSSSFQQFATTTGSGPQTFQFLFGSNTGTKGTGNSIGVLLHTTPSAAPDANFDVSFTNSAAQASAQSDTFALPEPASLSILAVAAPMFIRRRRSVK